MTIVQCWDDGVTTDVRLIEILKKYGAKATFNLNAGLHAAERKVNWIYKDTEVSRLGWNELPDVYNGFKIANHSLNHPHLELLPEEEAYYEIFEGRDRLQQLFGQPVHGFVYPYGSYNDSVMNAIRDTGHRYARSTKKEEQPFPTENPMEFHPTCHFLVSDFWARYQRAKATGIFYFWGHSYELISESMWDEFEKTIERISADPDSTWSNIDDLFITP